MGDLFYETLHKYIPPKLIYPGCSYILPIIYRLKHISGFLCYNQLPCLLDAWRKLIGIFCAPKAISGNSQYLHPFTLHFISAQQNYIQKLTKYNIIQPTWCTDTSGQSTDAGWRTDWNKKYFPCCSTVRTYFLTLQKSHSRNYSTPKVLIWPVGPGESANIWLKWLTYLWQVW